MKIILLLLGFCFITVCTAEAQFVNHAPHITVRLNNRPIPQKYINNVLQDPLIELFPGDTLRLVISTIDPDNDSVSINSNFTNNFPGSTFNVTNARNPTAYFYWVPTVADVSLMPIDFWLRISDHHPQMLVNINNIYQIRVNKPGSITLNNSLVNLNRDIELEPGTPMNLRFSSADPALADSIKIRSNVTSVLAGATFTTDFARRQTANINFTPTAAQVNPQPYSFTVTYQDNAPVPNQYIYTVNVKVRNAGVLGIAQNVVDGSNFSAFPNPFTDAVSFRIDKGNNAESILIYNLLGQQVDQVFFKHSGVGEQNVPWNNAGKYAAGTYVAKLIAANIAVQTLKFTKVQ